MAAIAISAALVAVGVLARRLWGSKPESEEKKGGRCCPLAPALLVLISSPTEQVPRAEQVQQVSGACRGLPLSWSPSPSASASALRARPRPQSRLAFACQL